MKIITNINPIRGKQAIIIKGPSGSGKSAISKNICAKYSFKHCDADEFKIIFSQNRSRERTEIAEYLLFIYTKCLIGRGYNLIIEAIINKNYMKKIITLLKRKRYLIKEVFLKASLKECLKRSKKRKNKGYDSRTVKNLFGFVVPEGRDIIINTNDQKERETTKEVIAIIL
jgi:adenylate kinase family enzyme